MQQTKLQTFPAGVWPTMLTPFLEKEKRPDLFALEKLCEWYLQKNVVGLFAMCQSSEMFFQEEKERLTVVAQVLESVGGRVPVIASGHVSDTLDEQIRELKAMAAQGVDALILVANRLAAQGEDERLALENLKRLTDALPPDVPLGIYECPYPYKRLLSTAQLEFMVNSGRFAFIKDTCCDIQKIEQRLHLIRGSRVQLFNANTATLLASLRAGAAGYSGVMANYHPELYSYLCGHWADLSGERADLLQAALSMCAFIEMKNYPSSAKAYLQAAGLPLSAFSRAPGARPLEVVETEELRQLNQLTVYLQKEFGL